MNNEPKAAEDNTSIVTLRHDVNYRKVKQLIYAAYYMGQEAGIEGRSLTHPTDVEQRENLVALILGNTK